MAELYAGPLLRWYRQDFPGAAPLAEPPDSEDVLTLITRWQAAFAPAIGAIDWPESSAIETRSASVVPDAWQGLLADAAAPHTVDAARALRPRDVPGYPLLQAIAWLPASFDGVLPIGLPDQPHAGGLASLDRLAAWTRTRRLQRWAAKRPRDAVDATLEQLADLASFALANQVPLLVAE